jgi:hypothetical protein
MTLNCTGAATMRRRQAELESRMAAELFSVFYQFADVLRF